MRRYSSRLAPAAFPVGCVSSDGVVEGEATAEVHHRDVLLKPTSSRMRKPSIFFSREQHVDIESSEHRGIIRVDHRDLGTAVPVFSILSPQCEYYAIRIPFLKAGFKRIPSPFLPFPCNFMWGKSMSTKVSSTSTPDFIEPSASTFPPLPPSPVVSLTSPHQRFNHFPTSHKHLGCKRGMHVTLSRAQKLHFTPQTFLFPSQKSEIVEHLRSDAAAHKKFIWKPARGSCGRGIVISRGGLSHEAEWTKVMAEISAQASDPQLHPMLRSLMSSFVVQEYIENPLIVGGRKLDLRLYVAVTSFDPLVVYLHEKGLVRFAAREYGKGDDVAHRFAHLTNYSLGRKLEKPQEEGGEPVSLDLKWQLGKFQATMDATYGAGHPTHSYNALMAETKRVIVETLLASKPHIAAATEEKNFGKYRSSFVEIFGFDIMFDDSGKAWLVEVNTLPSLESSSAMDYDTKSQVVTDLFNLSMMELFERPSAVFSECGLTVPGTDLHSNLHPSLVHKHTISSSDEVWSKADEFADIEARLHDESRYQGGFRRIFPCDSLPESLCDPSLVRRDLGPQGFTELDEIAAQTCRELRRGGCA